MSTFESGEASKHLNINCKSRIGRRVGANMSDNMLSLNIIGVFKFVFSDFTSGSISVI